MLGSSIITLMKERGVGLVGSKNIGGLRMTEFSLVEGMCTVGVVVS